MDPDPVGSGFNSPAWIRIRIQDWIQHTLKRGWNGNIIMAIKKMKSISKIFVHFHRYFSFKVMIGIICIKIFLGQDPDPDPVGSGFRVDPGSGFDVSGRIHTPDTNIPYLGQRRLLACFLSYSVFWQLQWNRQKSIGTLSVLLKIPIYLKSVKKKL